MSDLIISGIIGGLISILLFPLASYLLVRIITRWTCKLSIEKVNRNSATARYSTLTIRATNNSYNTLKNLTAFISIDYSLSDMVASNIISAYTVETAGRPLMLSWAKVVNDRNQAHIDINQAESADLNLFRHHDIIDAIEISAEQGFNDPNTGNYSRALLSAKKVKYFEILFTADNMWPIKKKIEYVYSDDNIRFMK